jgi:hypothetical protein
MHGFCNFAVFVHQKSKPPERVKRDPHLFDLVFFLHPKKCLTCGGEKFALLFALRNFWHFALRKHRLYDHRVANYSTSAEVQTFTCSDPQRTLKGTNFWLGDRGSFSNQTNQPQIRLGRLSKNDGGVPTVTGVCACRASCTRGGVALARTGSPQRTVWRRAR